MRIPRAWLIGIAAAAMLLVSACQNGGSREASNGSGGLEAVTASISASGQSAEKDRQQQEQSELGVQPDLTDQPERTQAEQTESTEQADRPEQAGIVPIESPMLIGEGTTKIGDGGETTVRLWLQSGKQVTDNEPGPFQGTYLYGSFELEAVAADGTLLPRVPLGAVFNNYGTISFRKKEPFKLLFDDYNADGNPDFTIGQWAGSNGNEYAMLTVDEEGLHLLAYMYSADHRESIRYRKLGEKAFVNRYYDIESGYKDVVRRWQDGQFVAEAPTDSQEGGSAGIDDEP